eukprot:gene4869-9701_t
MENTHSLVKDSNEVEMNTTEDDQKQPQQPVYVIDGEELIEVDVGDEPPIDDDESTTWSEVNDDNVEEVEGDELNKEVIEDMSNNMFSGHGQSVYSVEVHPSKPGVVISGGGDDKGYIWQYNSTDSSLGEMGRGIISYHELGGHTDTVTAVGFSFDGTLAFTAGYDGVIKVWDVDTGDLKGTFDGPQDIEWAQWHNKGRAIIAGSSDGTAWMWVEIDGNWQCMQVFAGAHDGGVSSGCFSKDGKYVCTGGEDGSIRIWAPKTGKCKHTFSGHFAHSDQVTCMASSTDGDLLLTGLILKLKLLRWLFDTPRRKSQTPLSTRSKTTKPGFRV